MKIKGDKDMIPAGFWGYSPTQYALNGAFFGNTNYLQNPITLGSMTLPMSLPMSSSDAYNQGRMMAIRSQLSASCASMANALNSMESQLSNLLNSDKLTSAQKATVKGLIEQIQAMRNKFAQQAKNATEESVAAMQKDLLALQEKVSKAADKIASEMTGASGSGSSSSSSSGSSSSSSSSTEDLSDEEKEKIVKKHEEAQKKITEEAANIIGHVYQGAVGCTGTNYKEIKKGTDKITKDNVTAVLNAYREQYSGVDGGDMIETLFDEEMGWNCGLHKRGADGKVAKPDGNVDIIWNIVKCLEERAKELDLYTSLSGQFNVAYDELDDTCVDEDAVKKAVQTITAAITEKEQTAWIEKAEKEIADTAKVNHGKKAEERRKETVEEKKAEFAAKMKEALNLGTTPNLVAGLKVETDDNGEFTGYSVKLRTPEGEVELKGSTYQELILEVEKHGLKAEDLIRNTVA